MNDRKAISVLEAITRISKLEAQVNYLEAQVGCLDTRLEKLEGLFVRQTMAINSK